METIIVYRFSELSDSAKNRAIDHMRSHTPDLYDWHYDDAKSLDAFLALFNVSRRDVIDRQGEMSYAKIEKLGNAPFHGRRLKDFDRESMPTGYFRDCDLMYTFFDTFKSTGNARKAFSDAIFAYSRAVQADEEYAYSDEAIAEMLAENEYTFTDTGKMI